MPMSIKDVQVDAMLGETLTDISGLEVGSDEVRFTTESGRTFRMYHSQDCCESVSVNEIVGNVSDLIGSPLLKSEDVSSADFPPPENPDSYTWTFYHFATIKGYVTLRWLGESNGYYSEGVDFVENRS
jgi:hypothetical protein